MTPDENKITDSSYTYKRSDFVPEWVIQMDDFKARIKAQLHSPDNGESGDIKFCHPINVPNTKK